MNRSNYLHITGLAFKFGALFFFHKTVCLLLSMLLLTASSKLNKFSLFFWIIYVFYYQLLERIKPIWKKFLNHFKKSSYMSKGL